jgi:uncharacterized membrane protein
MTHPENHTETPERHPRQDFQIDRIAFFSDAVVAIAITLLILEIKVPHFTKDSTYDMVMDQFNGLSYGLIALLVSFMVISSYWIIHHLLFKHIHRYNRAIIWANMVFLLTIIFFPFTTSLFSESGDNYIVYGIALKLFFLNNVLALLALTFIYWLAFKKYKEYTYKLSPADEKEVKNDLFFSLFVFSLVFIGTFFTSDVRLLLVINFTAVIIKRGLAFIKKRKKKAA